MGCFFGCFRIRDNHHHPQTHLASEPFPSKLREPVVSRNPLSSLLLADDKDGFPCKDEKNPALKTPEHGNNNRELKDEIQNEGYYLWLRAKDALVNALLVAAKRFSSGPSQVELLLSFCVEMGFSSVIPVGHDDGGLLALKATQSSCFTKFCQCGT